MWFAHLQVTVDHSCLLSYVNCPFSSSVPEVADQEEHLMFFGVSMPFGRQHSSVLMQEMGLTLGVSSSGW